MAKGVPIQKDPPGSSGSPGGGKPIPVKKPKLSSGTFHANMDPWELAFEGLRHLEKIRPAASRPPTASNTSRQFKRSSESSP
jgi:hypothetical protein